MLMAPGTKNGFPLAIEVEKMETVESEFRSEFTARMVQKVCATWHSARAPHSHRYRYRARHAGGVRRAAADAGGAGDGRHAAASGARLVREQRGVSARAAPRAHGGASRRTAIPSPPHPSHRPSHGVRPPHVQVEVIDGTLVCPETGKRFPIKDGIPSML